MSRCTFQDMHKNRWFDWQSYHRLTLLTALAFLFRYRSGDATRKTFVYQKVFHCEFSSVEIFCTFQFFKFKFLPHIVFIYFFCMQEENECNQNEITPTLYKCRWMSFSFCFAFSLFFVTRTALCYQAEFRQNRSNDFAVWCIHPTSKFIYD